VFEVDKEVEGLADYRVRTDAFDVRDEANAAGVVFVAGPIQASLVTEVFHGVLSVRLRSTSASARRHAAARRERRTAAGEDLLERNAIQNKSAISL
jgi:hypothetical protein